MNPYSKFISDYERLLKDAKPLPLGGFAPLARPKLAPDAPRVLIFSPHPDDECITGGLALRLMRESGMRVVNVAVTQGSNKARQKERLAELKGACGYLDFELVVTGADGLEKITPRTRELDKELWAKSVEAIAVLLTKHKPRVILFPHDRDWNSTHVGTHHLVLDALKQLPASFECFTVETEFWAQMTDPNLLVEVNSQDLGDLVSALTFHVGEVKRNPYHLALPAWMIDNVRRSEVVGGQGTTAPDFTFATIYRLRKWSQGKLDNVYSSGKFLSKTENPASLFA